MTKLLESTDRVDAVERLLASAVGSTSDVTFVTASGVERITWPRLVEEAGRLAAAMTGRGVEPGDAVAILGTNTANVVRAILATWLSGAATVMCQVPTRLHSIEEFQRSLTEQLAALGSRVLLVDEPLMALAPDASAVPGVVRIESLRNGAPASAVQVARAPSDLAILQLTSGSTGRPRAVTVTHGALMASLVGMGEACALDPSSDVLLSWLPLFHDMGLVGFLAQALRIGAPLVVCEATDFVARPARWLEWMSEFRATLSAGPNFAYAVAARSARQVGDVDLSAWRLAFNGAEPIDPETVDRFSGTFGAAGFRATAQLCVYGLAEATLGVTFPPPARGMAVTCVESPPAAKGLPFLRRPLPLLGTPIEGVEVRLTDHGEEMGEIEIRGPVVTAGYVGAPSDDDAFTADGWLRTGDLGCWSDGELVVAGRQKDMIIVAGSNLAPQVVERSCSALPGVRAGNVAAIGVPSPTGERLAVVVESRDPTTELAPAVREAVRRATGVNPVDVKVVAAGMLPKTSSGKLQRHRVRDLFLAGEL